MTQRYFTLEEAEAFLPKVEEVMLSVRDLKRRVDGKVAEWHGKEAAGPVEEALAQGHFDFLLVEINRRLETLSSIGILAKDIDMGLVDFPARIEGKEAYLCWKLGEKKIRFWHAITEGFQGRKPLKIAAENR